MKYITATDWTEFCKKFPTAEDWLIARQNRNEAHVLETMKITYTLTPWQQDRLEELQNLRKELKP